MPPPTGVVSGPLIDTTYSLSAASVSSGRYTCAPYTSADFFARVYLHPLNFPAVTVCFLNRCINDLNHHRRDIGPNPVAFNIRNDGLLGCLDRTIGLDDDSVSAGDLDMLIRHNDSTI